MSLYQNISKAVMDINNYYIILFPRGEVDKVKKISGLQEISMMYAYGQLGDVMYRSDLNTLVIKSVTGWKTLKKPRADIKAALLLLKD